MITVGVPERMLTLRAPDDLCEALDEAARENFRSRSAEMRCRLYSSFGAEHGVIVSALPAVKSDKKHGSHA